MYEGYNIPSDTHFTALQDDGEKTGPPVAPRKIWVQILKITCFLHFFATRWRRNHSKTPFLDSQRPITPILTHHTCLNSTWGRNGEKTDFEPSTGPESVKMTPKIQFLSHRIFSAAGLGAPRVRIIISIHLWVIYAKKQLTREKVVLVRWMDLSKLRPKGGPNFKQPFLAHFWSK